VDGIVSALGTALRVQDNDVYNTDSGIVSLLDVDLELRGNNIEDAALIGIAVMFSLHELTLSHDRALRCGYRAPSGFNPGAAIGIEILLSIALVTVEGCHVIDTGEAANQALPVFTGPRHGILVLWAIGARVRGCEVASKPLIVTAGTPPATNALSRAVRMWTLTSAAVVALLQAAGKPMTPFADAIDNIIEQSGMVLVEIYASGEAMCATNRCMNFAGGVSPVVIVVAAQATVTGNRVRSSGTTPALAVLFSEALSAVGNMTTHGALIVPVPPVGPVQAPSPYASFNVTI
jgi:hypothetical protein